MQQRYPEGGDGNSTPARVLPPFHLFNTGAEDLAETFGMVAASLIGRILIISAPINNGARQIAGKLAEMAWQYLVCFSSHIV